MCTGLAKTKKSDNTKFRWKGTLRGIHVDVITFVPVAYTTLQSRIILLATDSTESSGQCTRRHIKEHSRQHCSKEQKPFNNSKTH